jgi:alpha-tubulin suppressor-like RCC1 family protein
MRRRSFLLLWSAFACAGCDARRPTEPPAVVRYVDIVAGNYHSCGLATTGLVYCWGLRSYFPAPGPFESCAPSPDLPQQIFLCTPAPVPAAGGRVFRSLSGSGAETCGLTDDGRVDCFHSLESVPAGDLRFRRLSVGGTRGFPYSHACALTAEGKAYCWGANDLGQLGLGSSSGFDDRRETPRAVATELTFTAIAVGATYSCATVSDGTAHCWGWWAGLDGPDVCRIEPTRFDSGLRRCATRPLPVAAGLAWATLSGGLTLCGLTADKHAYCPINPARAVPGDLTFESISAGQQHTCGVAVGGKGYCWGRQEGGELGNGTLFDNAAAPVEVVGGLRFSVIRAGLRHTCGITVEGDAYCWGGDFYAQLGGGARDACPGDFSSICTVPRRVAQPAVAP